MKTRHWDIVRNDDRTPIIGFGIYNPGRTRLPFGVRIARGHFSAGIRNVIGFYIQSLKHS